MTEHVERLRFLAECAKGDMDDPLPTIRRKAAQDFAAISAAIGWEAEVKQLQSRVAALEGALRKIAEEQDRGRYDGKPEAGPAYDDPFVPWLIARAALTEKREEGHAAD